MKRFLSIMLCVMMLVSVFSISASAMVPTGETVVVTPAVPENVIINQDFSNEENLEFTASYDSNRHGTGTIIDEPGNTTNKVLQFVGTGNSATEKNMLVAETQNTVLTATDRKMTVEFRVYPVGQAETISVGGCMPAILAGTDDYDTKPRENYYIIYYNNFKADQWNTVKVEFDVPTSYSVSNSSYPAYGNADTATITVNGKVLTCVPGSAGKNAAEGKYTVSANYMGGSTPPYERELTYIALNTSILGSNNATVPEGGRTIYLDDIKVYVPSVAAVTEVVAYPIKSGNIYLTEEEALVFSGTGSTTTNKTKLKEYALTTTCSAPESVMTVELKNTVAGGPLTIHYGKTDGDKADGTGTGVGVGAINIASNDTIGRGWATYKIHFRQTGYNDPYKVYKKGENETTYTELTYGTDWNSQRSGGTDRNKVIFYYQKTVDKLASASEDTVWEVRNLQITDLYTFTGKAVAEDNELTVRLNTMLNKSADVIVATYDGSKLANVSYVPYTRFADTAEVTVPYTTGNTVKLFIWDGIATGVPVLNAAVPITVQ